MSSQEDADRMSPFFVVSSDEDDDVNKPNEPREYYHDRMGHERWLPPGESARELLMEAIDVEAHLFLIDSDVEHWGSDDEDDDDWEGESDERNKVLKRLHSAYLLDPEFLNNREY